MAAFDSVALVCPYASNRECGPHRTAGLGGGGAFDSSDTDLSFMFNVPNPVGIVFLLRSRSKVKLYLGDLILR